MLAGGHEDMRLIQEWCKLRHYFTTETSRAKCERFRVVKGSCQMAHWQIRIRPVTVNVEQPFTGPDEYSILL
jgi:hypothetical protein